MMRPSGCTTTPAARSSNGPIDVITTPPVPKVASGVPSARSRATAKSSPLVTRLKPARTIRPSPSSATARARSKPPARSNVRTPPAAKLGSSVPSARRRSARKSSSLAADDPAATIRPSGWSASANAKSSRWPTGTVTIPVPPKLGSRVPDGPASAVAACASPTATARRAAPIEPCARALPLRHARLTRAVSFARLSFGTKLDFPGRAGTRPDGPSPLQQAACRPTSAILLRCRGARVRWNLPASCTRTSCDANAILVGRGGTFCRTGTMRLTASGRKTHAIPRILRCAGPSKGAVRSAFVPPLEPDGRPGSRAPARGDAAPILSRSAHGAAAVVLMSVFLFLQRAAPADGAAPAPEPATPAVLTPADYADDGALVRLVWQHEPSVLEARAAAERAASEVVRARTYPNPTLDFTWGTIPVGPTNPPDLADPITNVPNYTFGLSELVEIAKRGPREAATVAEFEQADSQARATLLAKTFDLLRAIGKIARSQVRLASMAELVSASNELLDLDRARAAHGDVAPVDVERAEVEAVRLLASRDREVADLNAARAECTAIVATGCPEFASPHDARRFL